MTSVFVFSNEDKEKLFSSLATLAQSPYKDYLGFQSSVRTLISTGKVPDSFMNVCNNVKHERNELRQYAQLLRNVPIDTEIPVFEQSNPLQEKYSKKTTFIGESLLEAFAQLTHTPLLAYTTRNNGDFFHDVYAQKRYAHTQTQKTDGELFFHNDRTAHPIRADYLNLLGMRCSEKNLVYTSFLDGRNILEYLSEANQVALRQPYFITPYDEYSRDSNRQQVDSLPHSILEGGHSFRYYDTRTTYASAAPVEALDALLALKNAITKATKSKHQIRTGDLFSFANQDALHNRELVEINDVEAAQKRWLLKTYSFRNVDSLNRHAQHYDYKVPGLVAETGAAGLAQM